MIYTVTFNPALDYVMQVPSFLPGETNRAESEELQVGGKGINVSLVLSQLGVENTALGFLAGDTGELLRRRVESELEERREARALRSAMRQEVLEENFRRRTSVKLEILDTVADALETCREHLDSMPDLTGEALEARREDLAEAVQRVRDRQAIIRSRTAGTYRRSLRILRGNPSANTREFGEALEALRELAGKRPGPRA